MTVIFYRKACHTHTSPLITLVLFYNEKLPLVATCSTKQSRPSRPDYRTVHHNNSISSVLITWRYCCVPQTVPSATWSMHNCLATFHSTAQTLLRFKTHLLHWYVFFTLLSIQPYITCQHTNNFFSVFHNRKYFVKTYPLSACLEFQWWSNWAWTYNPYLPKKRCMDLNLHLGSVQFSSWAFRRQIITLYYTHTYIYI